MPLWPYQSDLVSRLGAALPEHRSVLLQLSTGGGKTHIAAHVAGVSAAVGERVWMIAHRREIVGQTSRSMASLGVPHGVVAADRPFEPDRPVQVCAIGTLARRAGTLPPPDLMIWDEAHHVAAKSWAALRARFPQARHLGLTATPERLDGKGLGDFFVHLICGPSTAELMAAGHLSPYRLFAPTIPDLRGVGLRGGDYTRDELAERMSGATLVGDAVEHYRRHADSARAVAFCVTVEASRALAARFNAAGIPAAHVGGDTPADERDAAIAALEAGRLRVLTNVEVFTEGFDLPAIDAVILLRPTRSLALHRQMVGRGLRAAPGKSATVILDHAGLFYDHGLPDEAVEWSLDQPGYRNTPCNERLRRCPTCSAVHAMAQSCPECGHAYTEGDRSIREVFGDLREIGTQPGHESTRAFMQRTGKSFEGIVSLSRKGMPRSGDGSIPVQAAMEWLAEYESHEGFRAFARRIKMHDEAVRKLLNKGMPHTPDLRVPVAAALEWLERNPARPSGHRYPSGYPAGACETQVAFAQRVGLCRTAIVARVKRGLPTAPNGWVIIEPALIWFKTHDARGRRKPQES